MSCWVVPLIAADYLKVPVEQIQERIKAGTIPTYVENGFTFVDVLPEVANLELPLPPRVATPPAPTFEVVSREEMVALTEPLEVQASDAGPHEPQAADFSWSQPRTLASHRRVAPRRAA